MRQFGVTPSSRRGASLVGQTKQEKLKPHVSLVSEFRGRCNDECITSTLNKHMEQNGVCLLAPEANFTVCDPPTVQTGATWEDCPLPGHSVSLKCQQGVHGRFTGSPFHSKCTCFPQAREVCPPRKTPQSRAVSRLGRSNRYTWSVSD